MVTAKIAEFLASVGFQADEKSLKTSLLKVAGFAVAVKLATVGVYAALTRVATGEVEIARKAEQLGTTTERMRELGYIAEQTGGSMDAVISTMEGLVNKNPRIRDAAKALDVVAARMRSLNEQQQKAYAKRMGIDPTLIPALTRDVSALKAEFKAMYAVAGTDGKAAAEASRSFLAEINKLSTVAGMLARSVAVAFLGKIRKDIEHLRRVVMENFSKIKRVLELVIAVVLRIAAVIGAMGYRIIKWVSALVDWFDNLDDGQRKVVVGAAALLAAWKLLNLGFLATPLGMIISGLLAIIALVDDYQTYMEGGRSYFDWGPWTDTIEEVSSAISAAVKGVGKFVSENRGLFAAIGKSIGIVLAMKGAVMAVAGAFSGVSTIVKVLWALLRANPLGLLLTLAVLVITHWEDVEKFFIDMWAKVEKHFPNFAQWAKDAVAFIKDEFGKAFKWLGDKLEDLLIGTAKMFGFVSDASPQGQPSPRGAPTNRVLMPNPAAQAQMAAAYNNSMQLNAKTDIHISTSDPIAAGNQAAAKQADANTEVLRNAQTRMR